MVYTEFQSLAVTDILCYHPVIQHSYYKNKNKCVDCMSLCYNYKCTMYADSCSLQSYATALQNDLSDSAL